MTLAKSAVANRIRNLDQQVVDQRTSYLESLKPQTLKERYKRWIFSAMSINTCLRQNVDNYKTVMAMPWDSLNELQEVMAYAGVSLPSAKSVSVWAITQLYHGPEKQRIFAHPAQAGWCQKKHAWDWFRDRMAEVTTVEDDSVKKMPWVGLKVVSFAHEMCWPCNCRVLAIDVHVKRWYGVKGELTDKLYHEIEEHWLEACDRYGFPPAIVRSILWDRDHSADSSRHWSHVFEDESLPILQTA